MRNVLLAALSERHACPLFLANQRLPRPELDFVLEAGRQAPSAMDIEPWRFLVVEDTALRQQLAQAADDTPQLTTCSAAIVIVARVADLRPGHDYVRAQLGRFASNQAQLFARYAEYESLVRNVDLAHWSIAQCQLALANMIAAAGFAELDACPIWRFDAAVATRTLGVDPNREAIAAILALGYCAVAAPEKIRQPLDQLVQYL